MVIYRNSRLMQCVIGHMISCFVGLSSMLTEKKLINK